MTTSSEKNTSALLHLSSLTQYFIPFGNYIFPILIWSSKKNNSQFIDENGKQVLNFQLSMLLYSLIIMLISIPIIIYTVLKNFTISNFEDCCNLVFDNTSIENYSGLLIFIIIAALLFGILKILEFALIIYASVKASNGETYNYPLTIKFLK